MMENEKKNISDTLMFIRRIIEQSIYQFVYLEMYNMLCHYLLTYDT